MTAAHPPSTCDTHAAIEADETVPAIHIWRDFAATPAQLFRAHTDPDVYARWVGPESLGAQITHWDARDGGSWSYSVKGKGSREDFETSFRGCFHTVREDRIVQTFTWDGLPDSVSLETLTFTDLGEGRSRLHAVSLCGSFEDRDAWLRSGMEVGVNDGYAALDTLLAAGAL